MTGQSAPGRQARVVITGIGVSSALGRGGGPLLAGMLAGRPAFGPVRRFSTEPCRVHTAALLPGSPSLADELAAVIDEACGAACLGPGPGRRVGRGGTPDEDANPKDAAPGKDEGASPARNTDTDPARNTDKNAHTGPARNTDAGPDRNTDKDVDADPARNAGPGGRAGIPLLVALHTDPAVARDAAASRATGTTAEEVARRCGLPPVRRTYVAACVAASTAVADAASMIVSGEADQVVVAAGYLADADSMGMFDAARALAADGAMRPFSAGRKGLLLGDGLAAVVLESAASARRRGAAALASLAGWGRAGDAYHVCQPRPDGSGLARAIEAALTRAGVDAAEIGYVNANGAGTQFSDAAEAAALHRVFGRSAGGIPVSSTKSVHGHALEASALVELVATILALRARRLPVNAGFLGPDPDCDLDLVLTAGREPMGQYALTLNAAFGGANTALVIGPV